MRDVRKCNSLTPSLVLLTVFAGCDGRDTPRGIFDEGKHKLETLGADIALPAGIQDRFSRLRGIAPADYDLDGDIDVFIANTGGPSRFFWNLGVDDNGDVMFQKGEVLLEDQIAYFASSADYDNDGDADLFIGVGGLDRIGLDYLFENIDGKFVDVSDAAGVAGPVTQSGDTIPGATGGGAWGDFDRDGWLDLYVTTQVVKDTLPDLKGRNTLYRNNGDGTFEDVTEAAGVGDTASGWAASWLDYDNDEFLDLFVPNRGGGPNVLYRNQRDGTFTDVATRELKALSTAWGSLTDDFNNDGWMDLFLDSRQEFAPNGLFINDKKGGFENKAISAGLNRHRVVLWAHDISNILGIGADMDDPAIRWPWMGFQSGDLTNDGLPEIVLGAGGPGGGFENHLFINRSSDDEVRFEIASSSINYPATDDGRGSFPKYPYRTHGMAFVDFDEDGDLDLLIGNGGPASSDFPEPNRLFRNAAGKGTNWIRLHLVGTASNRDGIGSRIILRSRNISGRVKTHHRMVKGISGFGGNNPIDPHFGIGRDNEIIDITIWWPSGVLQTIEYPSINTELTVEEPTTMCRESIMDLLSLIDVGEWK